MPKNPDPPQGAAFYPPRSYVLWCASCGTLATRSSADLLLSTRNEWMECCGQVMCYFSGASEVADWPVLIEPSH